jgi:arylsulfatase A-like enzyme
MVGWGIGVVLLLLLQWPLRRSKPSAPAPRGGRRRLRSTALTALGLAPLLLWLPAAVPHHALRRADPIGRRPGDDRPNLILITIDALRRDSLGLYGDHRGLTPNLDAFAKEATRYESAYAPSSWTLASLGGLFTGLPPSRSGLVTFARGKRNAQRIDIALPDDRTLLTERLQRAGYATAADVTNVFLEGDRGWTRGFNDFRNEGGADGDRAGLAHAQTLTGNASAWLRLNWHRPFFLWLHYLDPHCPYDSPDTPAALRSRYPAQWVARRDRWYYDIEEAPAPERARYQRFCRDMYAEEVRYVDRWLGRLLGTIRATGLYDSSLIVITADHGEELFDHGGIDHGHSMHEEVVAIPLLVKWPAGTAAEKRVRQVVPAVGITGTLLEFAHAAPLDGANARLPRRDGEIPSEAYVEGTLYGTQQFALVADGYKVTYHLDADPTSRPFEVYDRRSDRRERHDLAGTDAAADARLRLKRLVAKAEAESRRRGSGRTAPLSEEAKRRMRSLGYLGR